MPKFVLLDTETTGLNEDRKTKEKTKHRINQLGYIVIDGSNITPKEALAKPLDEEGNPIEIDFHAMATTGITPEMIEDKPELKDTEEFQFLNELNIEDNFMVIHNAKFDLDMLSRDGFDIQMKLIDTLRVAMHVYPDSDSHALQYLRYSLGLYKTEEAESKKLGIELKAHDAMGDILFMKMLLTRLKTDLIQQNKDTENYNVISDMIYLTTAPVLKKDFKFGKHYGELIENIAKKDPSYCRWVLNNMDGLDSDMEYTLNYYLNK